MTSLKSAATLALGFLVASTTLAVAEGKQLTPRETVAAVMPDVVLNPPVDPGKPQIPFIPLDIEPPHDPAIPIIPLDLELDVREPRGELAAPAASLAVDCLVKDPAPTTDDMWIVNVGRGELPAGIKLSFSVPSSGDRGAFLLNRSIAAGHKVKVAGLLSDAASGAPCRIQII